MAGTHRRLIASFSRVRVDDWQRWCAGSLASTPPIATRSWYIQQINQREHGDLDPQQSDAGFNMFAAASAPFISTSLVQQDIDSLSAVITKVNTFTTKNLATFARWIVS